MSGLEPMKATTISMMLGIDLDTTISLGYLPAPDFARLDCCTHTEPTMTDEQFEKAIIEQAKKDAAKGVCGGTKGYNDLLKGYVSSASPDRRSVITRVSKQLAGKGNVNFLSIKDNSGNEIAQYSSRNGWHTIMTNPEMERQSAFCDTYITAWRDAFYGNKDEDSDVGSQYSYFA